jgi:DNA-binding Lrp family transcriptional regulator
MVKAFVLVNVDLGAEKEALKQFRAFPEVKESYLVYGLYDVVAFLETNSMGKLKEAIGQKVRTVDGVKSTITTVVT